MFSSNWFNSLSKTDKTSTNTELSGIKKFIDHLMPRPSDHFPFSFPIGKPLEIADTEPDLLKIPLEGIAVEKFKSPPSTFHDILPEYTGIGRLVLVR